MFMFFFSGYNMALRRTASQSETLWSYDAALAVDGDPNTCSFTPQSDVQRWWQVGAENSWPGCVQAGEKRIIGWVLCGDICNL